MPSPYSYLLCINVNAFVRLLGRRRKLVDSCYVKQPLLWWGIAFISLELIQFTSYDLLSQWGVQEQVFWNRLLLLVHRSVGTSNIKFVGQESFYLFGSLRFCFVFCKIVRASTLILLTRPLKFSVCVATISFELMQTFRKNVPTVLLYPRCLQWLVLKVGIWIEI